jgi:hypothetical protein
MLRKQLKKILLLYFQLAYARITTGNVNDIQKTTNTLGVLSMS